MSLFGSFSGKREKEINKTKITGLDNGQAIVFLAYLVFARKLSDSNEISVYLSIIRKFFKDELDHDSYNDVFDSYLINYDKPTLIKDCLEIIKDEHKETIFTFMVDGVLSDGILSDEEEKYISLLQKLMNIDADLAKKIVDVMLIKNKEFEL